jgi:nicotinate-nucleotide adenylyltransferase
VTGRLGVFGGTFDPIHLAHLIVAEHAREQLQLDRVLFVPAAEPPHKGSTEITAPRHRLEMVRLAIAGNRNFFECELELRRAGPSYTVDTLSELHRQFPDAELFLLLGADSLMDLGSWREPQRILQLAQIAVAARPDCWPIPWEKLDCWLPEDRRAAIRRSVIEIPLLGISSSEIRQRRRLGQSIRYLVPAAVEAYIDAHKLYSPLRSADCGVSGG